MDKPLGCLHGVVICLNTSNHFDNCGGRVFLENLAGLEEPHQIDMKQASWETNAHTLINPSAAHRAARFARPLETPNSSRTAVNDCKSPSIDWAEMRFVTVRCAKK
jgi:hypothetical protein